MDNEKLRKEVSQKRELYIRQLEEQLAVYQEKDRIQTILIEKLQQALDLSEEVSRLKDGKKG